MKSLLLYIILVVCLSLLASRVLAQSPDDYPEPRGNPENWNIPGTPERLVPQATDRAPVTPYTPPERYDNRASNRPGVPAGESQEKYTGTRESLKPYDSGLTFGPMRMQR